MQSNLELKVLAGPHAGAKAALRDKRILIGSAEDCDIVLGLDDVMGRHAAILAEGGGVVIEPLEGEVTGPDGAPLSGARAMPPFAPFSLGATVIAIGEAGAVWPRVDPTRFAPRGPAPIGAEQAASPRPAKMPVVTASARSRDPSRLTLYPLIVLLVIGIGFIASNWFTGKDGGVPPRPAPLAQARAALAALGLADDIEVRAVGERVLLITGYVELSDHKTSLKEQVKVRGADVVFRVWAKQEQLLQARDRVAELAPGLRVETVSAGAVRLSGYLADPDRRNRVVLAVREDVPGLREVVDDIVTRPDAERMLRQAVAESPLSGRVSLLTRDGDLVAEGILSDGEIALWQTLLADFRSRYAADIPVGAVFLPRTEDLPFALRAVLAGPSGFVVTQTGRRVMVGGELGAGYVLEAIGQGELTIRRGEQVFVRRFRE